MPYPWYTDWRIAALFRKGTPSLNLKSSPAEAVTAALTSNVSRGRIIKHTMEHGGLLWALARRLINRPRKASQITRRRYGPRATGGSQHDHMGKLKGRGSTYIHACKIDQTVTVPLAPQPAAKSSYPKLPSSHLTHPQLEKMGEKKGKVRLLNPQIYHAPRRRPEGVFCHRVGFFLATRSPTPTAKYFPSHRPSMSGARCRPLTYARRRGLRALGSGLRLKRRRRQRQPSPPPFNLHRPIP